MSVELTPVTLQTRYAHLEQLANGGKVKAADEFPWKVVLIVCVAGLGVVYYLKSRREEELEVRLENSLKYINELENSRK